jgi:hypothetical protein
MPTDMEDNSTPKAVSRSRVATKAATRRQTPWCCLALVLGAPVAFAQPSPWGLVTLMHQMAQVKSASAHFSERKTLHVLDAPLIAAGTLTYVAPDYLQKRTLTPSLEIFVLDHGQASLTGGPAGQSQTFSLRGAPQIGGLVEGIRATLTGDLPALEQYYSVELSGDDAAWQLILRPKDPAAARFVAWILIRGSSARITVIDTASGNGDHSEMGVSEDIHEQR